MFDWKDILERAIWTFVQAFAGAWPVGFIFTDWQALKIALAGAMSAGVAAVLSLLKNMVKQRRAA